MHKLAEKITDCLKAKVEGMGIDNIEGQNLVEFQLWSEIAKNLVCYDKDKRIIEAMDESDDSRESMKYIETYEDYPEERKGYRGQPRNSKGQYMRRRGYMQPHETYSDEELRMMQNDRDMDRQSRNVMYYTDGSNMSGNRGNSESRYDMAKRGYQETKQMNKDKGEKMKSLEDYMKSLAEDVTEMVNDMSQEEKSLMKQKMQVLMQKIN